MKTKHAVWLVFFLNLGYAIVEFIAGGIFGSSAVLADSVHDLGDAIAIGISAFLESISNREEDSHYTLGYKRFSLLGAMVTAVILMTGSVLVILENITKLFHPQPVNDEVIFHCFHYQHLQKKCVNPLDFNFPRIHNLLENPHSHQLWI